MSTWDEINADDYLPFLEFDKAKESEVLACDEDTFIAYIKMKGQPVKFTNKWNKEQLKIRVAKRSSILNGTFSDHNTDFWLAGGIKLFSKLKQFAALDGWLKVVRWGKGFDTEYAVSEYKFGSNNDLTEYSAISKTENKKTKKKQS